MIKRVLGILGFVALSGMAVCVNAADTETRKITTALSDSIGDASGNIRVDTTIAPLDVSKGDLSNHSTLNKFGLAPTGVQTTATDIWDRADATPTQQTWTAPTQARAHTVKSSSASDDGSPAGVGARTIRVYGLTDWASGEDYEDITMDGTSTVTTTLSYVAINKMKVLTKGATNVNVGAITATAATDNTVTAAILAGEGETHMAIESIPSSQDLYLYNYYGSVNKASGAAAHVNLSLKVNEEPDTELTNFVTLNTRGLQSTGNSSDTWEFYPPLKVTGPAIVKVQGIASAADVEGSAGFSGILVDDASLTDILAENGDQLLGEHGRNLIKE